MEYKSRSMVLISVFIGTLMSAIDTTIVLLAIPTITDDLKVPFIKTIWIIIIYLLILAALTTQMGRLGDIFGRSRIFYIGFIIFIAGSAAAGASPNINYLIISRGFQAFGAVLLQANSNAIVADYFPVNERGRAFGITSMGWNIGGSLGIILGGIITTFIGWRYIFYINVPIGIIGFIIALIYIKDNNKNPDAKIDVPGTALLLILLSLIAYGAVEIAGIGIKLTYIAMILAGIILIIPFIFIEKISRYPVIEISAFRERMLSFSLIAATLQAIGYLAVLFILIMYLQGIRGFTPFYASLILIPGYILASFLAPRMGRLSDRTGPRILSSIGIFIMAAGIIVYLTMKVSSPIYIVIIGSIITGIGSSMFWPSNSSAVMSSAPRRLYGSISGLLRSLSNIGTLISYVLAITIASITVPRYVAFEVFLGIGKLNGAVSVKFLSGIDTSLLISFFILIVAGIAALIKGKSYNENKKYSADYTK
ncbi:MFS transporter [Picrophilus oshimae]|uniref:Drug resistance transporter, EmrB/QacA subfamily n=1 Tax=Picrophilus torridus (strain ATCC 700027 / DSM 9790 / JCM 10055 / NBRC 100828 / KAW 2/3) TaxID=1122961 RepID=A0A8G2FVK0_PICTO|nr:MFS transporter [Picrophilus oshimae]SMD30291.1 drug resistance transporter, EmrB/QacA subfamily [Picrophilus oshimae DSM 9789]